MTQRIFSKLVLVFFRILAQSKRNLFIFPFLINFHLFMYISDLIFPSLYGNCNL